MFKKLKTIEKHWKANVMEVHPIMIDLVELRIYVWICFGNKFSPSISGT